MSEGAQKIRQFGDSGGGGKRHMGTSSSGSNVGNATTSAHHRHCSDYGNHRINGVNTGILDEQVLALVFRALKWDPKAVCVAACVSRRLRAVAERVLWRDVCIARAPRMVAALTAAAGATPGGRIGGGWPALAKLLFYCCGANGAAVPGHFVKMSRFSKTSGRSFLPRRCWGDLLYVSDPCEHTVAGAADDLGAYRGVFQEFMRSRTRACLLSKQAELETRVRCPYCGARVWSMTASGLVPRSAWRRLGAYEGCVEYFVCVRGHLHGSCWLAHLSSSEGEGANSDDGDDEEEGHVTL